MTSMQDKGKKNANQMPTTGVVTFVKNERHEAHSDSVDHYAKFNSHISRVISALFDNKQESFKFQVYENIAGKLIRDINLEHSQDLAQSLQQTVIQNKKNSE